MKIKLLSLLFFALYLNNAFSQEGFIINTDGEKIIVDGSKVELLPSDEKFEYQELGSDKKSKIRVDKITSATFGNFRIETFSIEKKPRAYFIIAEMLGKKLVGYSFITSKVSVKHGPSSMSPNPTSSKNVMGQSKTTFFTKYFYYIVDESNKMVEALEFDSLYGDKNAKKRDAAEAVLRKYFSNCPELIGRLNKYDTSMMNFENASERAKKVAKTYDEGNAKMWKFFNNPEYSKCNQTIDYLNTTTAEIVTQSEPLAKTENIIASQYDGTYMFESLSMDYRGSKRDMGIKGTYIIKDGFVEIKSKDNSPKYKIKNIKDGIIYCEDKNMIHTIKVEPETGKKKGFDYDTKIIFIADKVLGGSIAEYKCKKQ